MRRIKRLALGEVAQAYLRKRQSSVSKKATIGLANVQQIWKNARQGVGMAEVLGTLQSMMGSRQRCMYCLDSHGCDIEHFRPKAKFPKWMFKWNNLLICCTECGRIKGEKFPMGGKHPMLIDPTKAEPWDDLDFDPTTGNITARFDLQAHDFSAKGQQTVNTLQLDRREALAVGYLATYKKLCAAINGFLNTPSQNVTAFIDELIDEDERGMLGWCFKGTGQNEAPLRQLKLHHPAVWQACLVLSSIVDRGRRFLRQCSNIFWRLNFLPPSIGAPHSHKSRYKPRQCSRYKKFVAFGVAKASPRKMRAL